MAFPTILVNSASGSDTAASGAGPTVALTGSAASTSADGLTVTLDGSPNLSSVATDGSAALFLVDATAGARNFGRITAVDNAAKTVTVDTAFRVSASGLAWALGGVRASVVSNANSRKLIENNSAAGDAMPGWVIEMQSGHTETHSGTVVWRRGGSTANGPITLRGASAAATLPVLTWSNNGDAIGIANTIGGLVFENFELRNTNATKTSSVAINSYGGHFLARRLKIAHSTNKFWRGCVNGGSSIWDACEVAYCAAQGIFGTTSGYPFQLNNCWIHDNVGSGVAHTDGWITATYSVFSGNGVDGIQYTSGQHSSAFIHCVFYGNASDGIEITTAGGPVRTLWLNNIFANNGGYGVNFSNATWTAGTDAAPRGNFIRAYGNVFWNNTSGKYRAGFQSEDELLVDPTFGAPASGDFRTTNTALVGYGWPSANNSRTLGGFGSYGGYPTPGALTPQASTGSGSTGGAPIIGGGIVRAHLG